MVARLAEFVNHCAKNLQRGTLIGYPVCVYHSCLIKVFHSQTQIHAARADEIFRGPQIERKSLCGPQFRQE
jgi:hypothetical protein